MTKLTMLKTILPSLLRAVTSRDRNSTKSYDNTLNTSVKYAR